MKRKEGEEERPAVDNCDVSNELKEGREREKKISRLLKQKENERSRRREDEDDERMFILIRVCVHVGFPP